MVASFKLILCGPICVDCKYNFDLNSKCVDFPPNSVFCVEGCQDYPDLLFRRIFCLPLILAIEDKSYHRSKPVLPQDPLPCWLMLS